MMQLYPHQTTVIDELRQGLKAGHIRQILGAPTGSGKTVVAAQIILNAAQRGKKSLFIVDRITLVQQAVNHLEALGLAAGIIQGENTHRQHDENVIVASIQSLRRRGIPDVDLIIVDECHVLHKAHIELMQQRDLVPVLGLSATPMREGLGLLFSNLVRAPSTADLIQNKYLVPFRCFGPSVPDLKNVQVQRGDFVESQLAEIMQKREIVGDVVSTWKRLGENRKTICFAVNIAHSKALTSAFQSEGINAAHLDCYAEDAERNEAIMRFRYGDIQILSSVAVLAVGFDAPEASCIVMARPTMSEMLFIQQAGRGPRLCEGKNDVILLDHAGNCARFGLPQNFVIPDLDNGTGKNKKTVERDGHETKPCSECGFMILVGEKVCHNCGHERTRQSSVVQVDGDLIPLSPEAEAHQKFAPCRYCGGESVRLTEAKGPHGSGVTCNDCDKHLGWMPKAKVIDQKQFYLELVGYAFARNFKPGWAAHSYRDKFGSFPPDSYKAHEPITPSLETLRWLKHRQIRFAKSRKAS